VFKCKVCGEEFEDRVSLMNHYRTTHPRQERGEQGEGSGGAPFSPVVDNLQQALLQFLPPKNDRLIDGICRIAEKNVQVIQNPINLRSFLSKFPLPQNVVESCVMELFGVGVDTPPQFGYPPAPWHQGYPSVQPIYYQQPGSREVYQYGWFPVPTPSQGPSSTHPPQASNVVSREELKSELASLESRIVATVQSSLQRSREQEERAQAEREAEKRREQEVEERVTMAEKLARLESKLDSDARIAELESELRGLKETRQQAEDPRVTKVEAELRELRGESQLREAIESLRREQKEEIARLEASLLPSRQPTDRELQSENLKILLERVSGTLQGMGQTLERLGGPVVASNLIANLKSMGVSDDAIPDTVRAIISETSRSVVSRPEAQGASLKEKADEFSRKYLKPEAIK